MGQVRLCYTLHSGVGGWAVVHFARWCIIKGGLSYIIHIGVLSQGGRGGGCVTSCTLVNYCRGEWGSADS